METRKRRLFTIITFISILLLLLIFLDYLPLHDIYKDYVSKNALRTLNITTSESLPEWTGAELEWNAITVNYFLKLGLAVINMILITILFRKAR